MWSDVCTASTRFSEMCFLTKFFFFLFSFLLWFWSLCHEVKHNSFYSLKIFFHCLNWGQFGKLTAPGCLCSHTRHWAGLSNHLCSVKHCYTEAIAVFGVVVRFSLLFVMQGCCTDYQHLQYEWHVFFLKKKDFFHIFERFFFCLIHS